MNLEIIILAAGKGSRMKSSLPKVLHPVAGSPMLQRVVDTAQTLAPRAIHVVVGHGADDVKQAMGDAAVNWVTQAEQRGTGHAVLQALPVIGEDSVVLVLYGDVPLIRTETLTELVAAAASAPAVLTARVSNPAGLGRILRDNTGKLLGVVEHKDASQAELAIDEINTGVMAVPAADLRSYLPRVGNENAQGEYYLPDVLSLAVADGRAVASCMATSEVEVLGVNDRVQLNRVEREFQRRRAEDLLLQGVAVADVSRLDIRGELTCGSDVFIDVNVVIEGVVQLEDGARIGPNCVLKNAVVGAGAQIHAMSHIEEATIGPDANVGPYARLRPGTELAAGARVGNFVETKKARIGVGSKINHLSYVGDCEMGAGVNIGAGTITCNYDGVNKHKTTMGDGVFVGSNSTLVAPIEIADGGFVGAGSTVTKAVGEDELAVSRAKQRNIQGWNRPGKPDGEQ
ncbi:bifunctional N-acetylglucosamine-1-phosphate uridyltransferase/glucosamine-1-phosphate acetyltransferase [Halioglobus sp. HI00S01]|uniref:bifunctional UDP-N-acetylglucosamine diphosphorylase/glucosamine-1-phosphate N-acetyltransferase GlmU n=1 Tax=Halioglobus sp. HI00S01 TaxID=1822214 RepID=UPI0007C255B9|nr:bifunctional UDP-N-acetylglucosamine diphosphorylase/glucosamine-1-phosphate N-acetyltransferase GlmU [Halioglobus sp. HI00S01]KZX55952.1 bifunctional N-acetylglucosamine-1-phosphate uridyltransferase/glucosamine-1-phosphate acetyltransferase [Halioglobus sp. HI00S01]